MKHYVQFLTTSTGYVEDSIPPQYKPEAVKPIPMCDSDGVYIFDGRIKNRSMLFNKAMSIYQSRKQLHPSMIGFEVIRAASFLDTGYTEFMYYETTEK